MERARENLIAVLVLLDSKADRSAATVRLAALAWLVRRGLRRTACCADAEAVEAVGAALDGTVEFEVRDVNPGLRDECYWLSGAVVLYAPGARGELAPAWAEHRRTYTRGAELGRTLGYFAPRERLADGEAPKQVHLRLHLRLHHFAALPGGPY